MAKKKVSRERPRRLMVCFSEAEYAPIAAKAKKQCLPIATYIRQVLVVSSNP